MSDVEGIVERLREMGEFFGPNIPTRPVREKLSAVDARHCDEASALMLEGADEIARLNAALQYEQHRSSRIGTHGVGCWAWGPQHYECAMAELQSRDATISRLERGGLGWLYTCDDGWAWSENHPIDSGESVYATNVRRATNAELVERLKDLSEGHNEALASEARASARVAAAEARAQKAEAALGEAVKVVEPFAAKLADIGEDEDDDDGFAEVSPAHRRAPRITVGHFRAARTFLSKQGLPNED